MGEAGIRVKVTETSFEGELVNVKVFGKLTVFSSTCSEQLACAAGSPLTCDLSAKISLVDPRQFEVDL